MMLEQNTSHNDEFLDEDKDSSIISKDGDHSQLDYNQEQKNLDEEHDSLLESIEREIMEYELTDDNQNTQ